MQPVNNINIINRAGMIPYFIDDEGTIHMMFMVPTKNDWIESVPQVSKGRIEPGEILLKAAIREATEELGLKPSNLSRIETIGQYSTIMFYIGQVNDPDDFGDFDPIETERVVWMTQDEFKQTGRELHVPVVDAAVVKIKEILNGVE